MTIEVDGRAFADYVVLFERFSRRQAASFVAGVHDLAKETLRDAQGDYVPVRTGRLRDSGYVDPVPLPAGHAIWQVDVSFSTRYARLVHERPADQAPFHADRPLSGPKYLERAVIARLAGASRHVADRVTTNAGE